MSDIVLTAGVRSNLLQLQKTADLITNTQTKLATGKRVNSALSRHPRPGALPKGEGVTKTLRNFLW